jgi:uncharacterized protein DUF4388
MALEGTLKDFGLADIFQLIGNQRKTGVLTLKSPDDVVTVSFLDGSVVSADSQNKKLEDLLGSVLVKSGRISDDQLQHALRNQRRTLQRLGNILINEKFISDEDLSEALRLQVTQVVYRLFRWSNGDYLFKQERTIEYDREHFTPLTAESILMEGIRMIDEWPIIEKKIRSVNMVFALSNPGAPIEIQKEDGEEEDALGAALTDAGSRQVSPPVDSVVISAQEAKVYDAVDGQRTVQEVIDRSGLGDFETCRVLYDLLARGLIREIRREAPRRAEPAVSRQQVSPGFWTALSVLLLAGAAFSAVRMGYNPINRLPPAYEDPLLGQLLTSITRSRVERVDEAIQVYYLQKGFYPDDLAELARGHLVGASALKDAWGRSLEYVPLGGGYRLLVPERSDLSLEHHSKVPSPARKAGDAGGGG